MQVGHKMGRHKALVKCGVCEQDVPGRYKADHLRKEHLSETFFCFLCHRVQYRFSNFINYHLPKCHQDDLGEVLPQQLDLNSVAYWAVCPDTFNRFSKGPSLEDTLLLLSATYLGDTVDNRSSDTFMDYVEKANSYGLTVRVQPPNRFPEELEEPEEPEEPDREPQGVAEEPRASGPVELLNSQVPVAEVPRQEESMDVEDVDDDCSITDVDKPRIIFLDTEQELAAVPPLPLPIRYPKTLLMLESSTLGSLPSACEVVQTREDRIVVYEGAENFVFEQPRGFREETVTLRYRSPGSVTHLEETVSKDRYLIYLMPAGDHCYQYAEELQK